MEFNTKNEKQNKGQTQLVWGLVNIEWLGEIYKQQTSDEKNTFETIIIYLNRERTQSLSVFISRVKATKNSPFRFNVGFDKTKDVYIRNKTKEGDYEKQKVSFEDFKKVLESEKWPPIKFFKN